MRSAGNDALRRAAHLFEFRHQVGLGVETPGGVDDHVIAVPRGSRLQRVVEHGCRIAAGFGSDDFRPRTLSPDFQLLDGGGAEGIGCAQQHRLTLRTKNLRQFANRRRFARSVDTDHEDDLGCAVDFLDRARIGSIQNGEQLLFQQAFEFVCVLDLLAVGFVPKFVQHFAGGGVAQIGADERGFQVVQGRAVNLFAEWKRLLRCAG